MSKRLITFFISLISLIFIVNISRSIYTLWQKGGVVAERAKVREAVKKENNALTEKLKDVESPEFIERQARDKLNLQKDGEVVVVLPKDVNVESKPQAQTEVPNWQKWWRLFF